MWKWLGSALAIIGTAAITIGGFLLGESWIIALVGFAGFWLGGLVLTVISVIISWIIIYIYSTAERKQGIIWRIQNWVKKKEQSLSPTGSKIAKTSKILGLIISSVTVGPFITTIFIKTLGYKQKQSYFLAFLSSFIFSIVWSAIYSGAIKGIKILIERII